MFVLNDPDMLRIYEEYLEGDDPEAQRLAALTAAQFGTAAKPLRESLRRLQARKYLDPGVAEDVKTAIDQIDGRK